VRDQRLLRDNLNLTAQQERNRIGQPVEQLRQIRRPIGGTGKQGATGR
jgi:hypothetical protein